MSTRRPVTVSDCIRALLNDTLVWDMTVPWESDALDQSTLPRFKAASVDLISLTVNTPTYDATVRHIAAVLADIRTHADTVTLIRSVDDVFEARETDKLGLTLNVQKTSHAGWRSRHDRPTRGAAHAARLQPAEPGGGRLRRTH